MEETREFPKRPTTPTAHPYPAERRPKATYRLVVDGEGEDRRRLGPAGGARQVHPVLGKVLRLHALDEGVAVRRVWWRGEELKDGVKGLEEGRKEREMEEMDTYMNTHTYRGRSGEEQIVKKHAKMKSERKTYLKS